ncbi:MAG TPA: Holliday junction branch migration protein RuvA [Clostridia bacterium]|jgi:Holliday junction DNA helicase RuvA|nr:Holliday junction branch migration protein RuvA [Clostridia bacterium]
MIDYIVGKLVDRGNDYIVVEAGGIGYLLTVSNSIFQKLPPLGSEIKVYTYLAVKEDELSFYGFLLKEEKQLFTTLISIQGIGPKTAISLLSKVEPKEFIAAICNEDLKKLSTLPGIGRKTAQRLVLELRDKLVKMAIEEENSLVNLANDDNNYENNYSVTQEVVSALEALGYRPVEYGQVLQNAVKELGTKVSTEDYLKYVLGRLGS